MRIIKLLANHQTFAILLATIVLMELAHGIELIALFPLYLSSTMREGADVIGITLSTYLVADILTRTPAGWAADRWARKPILAVGILLSALPLLVMPRVESPTLFLALNAVNGIGAGCTWPAIYAAVADAYGRERYGLVLGIINMVMLGGIALGPIAGGFLLSRVTYGSAFVVCFAIVAVAFVLVLAFAREARAGCGDAPAEAQPWRTLAQQMNSALVRLLVIGLLLTLALGMMLPLISLFGRDVLRVPPDIFALILIPPGILTAALIIPAGHWADRRGRHTPLIIGLILIAIPFAGAPLSVNPLIVSAGAALAGLGYALLVPAWNALVMDWIPSNARGLFLGAVATAQGIGLAVGPSVGGALWERVGVYAPFEAAALFLGFAVLLTLGDARQTIPTPIPPSF
jgi:DHA1 family multidrug resistance protein-like MFS transporter